MSTHEHLDLEQLASSIKSWGQELGFQQVGITDTDLSEHEQHLDNWLAKSYQGSMSYMAKHGQKRTRPEDNIPGTLRVISVRMDYLPPNAEIKNTLKNKQKAYVSRYALGRDYHKVLKNRLKELAEKISKAIPEHQYRVFVDSAPVMEKALAEKAGLGWIGKHTNLINRKAGSWFFLGELYTNLPLPVDQKATRHCGSCQACIDVCPTQAIVAPFQVDARRCISYLTIENKAVIPEKFRKAMGNRIYGCDDCQLVCPWNKFAKPTDERDFKPRHGLKDADLLELFQWDEPTFLKKTEGSAIRRIGYESWQRNIAVALGNAPYSSMLEQALLDKRQACSSLVAIHIDWALEQQRQSAFSL